MKIRLGGKKIVAHPYDDSSTLLQKYSLDVAGSKPSFFRITTKDYVLEDGAKLKVDDVREYISGLGVTELLQRVPDIVDVYPGLSKRDIGWIWMFRAGNDPKLTSQEVDELSTLDSHAFRGRPSDIYATRMDEIEKYRIKMAEKIEQREKIFERLAKEKEEIAADDFIPTEIYTRITLALPGGENLLDIFDAFDLSIQIPFVHVVFGKRKFYKVYKHMEIPKDWLSIEDDKTLAKMVDRRTSGTTTGLPDGIYFKLLNAPVSKLSSKQDLLQNLFATGVWTPKATSSTEAKIDVAYVNREGESEAKIAQRIYDALGERLRYEILGQRQAGIGGTFDITSFAFNKYVFSDLMSTDATLRYFLFANERMVTLLDKERFYIYFSPTGEEPKQISESLALIITPRFEYGTTTIRISYAKDSTQANLVRVILLRLFAIYQRKLEKTIAAYTEIIPSFKKITAPEVKALKVDKKTGARAKALKLEDPSLFRSRYPDSCQREKQPKVITEEEAEALLATFNGPQEENGRAMFFEGKWYGCDPREPDESGAYIWPGLQVNKSKDPEYVEAHKFLPCCFAVNQATKKSSATFGYRRGADKTVPEKKKGVGAIGHIMGPAKPLPSDRYGRLPYNWTKLLVANSFPLVKIGNQEMINIFRHSVLPAPDSFFHCLERAFNPAYAYASPDQRTKMVMDARDRIASAGGDFAFAKQELYDYGSEEIQEMLRDPSFYIAAEDFVSVGEKYYRCNIFMYLCDSLENVDGNILTPRFSKAYLPRIFDSSKPSVLIIKYEASTEYGFQCEVVSEIKTRGDVSFTFPGDHPIVVIARKLFDAANDVYILSPSGASQYV